MSGFSAEWLALREPADRRARNRELEGALSARFALRDEISVLDLGSGTGANLRALAPLLPAKQVWTLTDRDPALLDAAKTALAKWADASEEKDGCLHLSRERSRIEVSFRQADLAREAGTLIAGKPNLVTASAFFDLVSPEFIRALASSIASARATFYAALTYNGLQRWTPHRPTDNQMTAAFHQHQMRDKGFGIAAGPIAASQLADQFRINDYMVLEGRSDWRLDGPDRMLVDELVRGYAVAVGETGMVKDTDIVGWVNVKRTGAIVGHEDIFAVPG